MKPWVKNLIFVVVLILVVRWSDGIRAMFRNVPFLGEFLR